MNKRLLAILAAGCGVIVCLAVVGVAGWFLVSPAFIDTKVDEAFPFELPDEEALSAMSPEEMDAMEQEFLAAVPDEEDLAGLSPEEQATVEAQVQDAADALLSETNMDEAMPPGAAEPQLLAEGQFTGRDSFHQGSGRAALYQLPDGGAVLRLEDFEVTNGPDLHVVLSQNPSPSNQDDLGDDYIDLGSLKGNVGNQNYEILTGTDLSLYQGVVIYCMPFHVVFATAPLN